MKLSEAIRLGAMMKPQGRGAYQSDGHSCALGAAMDAVGIQPELQDETNDRELFPVMQTSAVCPVCCERKSDLGFVVVHLNDEHRWTREQIADWVATFEAQQEQSVQPEPVAAPVGE